MRKDTSEGVSPSHVMSAEALDRRHDEVEIALDFPRARLRNLDGICDAVEYRQRVLLRAAFGIGIALAPHGNVAHRRNGRMLGLSGGLPVML